MTADEKKRLKECVATWIDGFRDKDSVEFRLEIGVDRVATGDDPHYKMTPNGTGTLTLKVNGGAKNTSRLELPGGMVIEEVC